MGRCSPGIRMVRWRFVMFLVVISFTNHHRVEAQPFTPSDLPSDVPPNFAPLPPTPPLDSLPPGPPIGKNLTAAFIEKLNTVANQIGDTIVRSYSFCISDIESDKRRTYDFTDPDSFVQCAREVGVEFGSRVCGSGEIELYFNNIQYVRGGVASNVNCNPSDRPDACQSGWSGILSNVSTDLNSKLIPERTRDPLPCCSGFFCPPGLTCMIPCPLGAYCPQASYSPDTGSCSPYGYAAPITGSNAFQCGGADFWLTYNDAKASFCGQFGGTYCPNTVTSEICESGHFCRIGTTSPSKCSFLTKCNKEGVQDEDVTTSGILLIVVLFIILLLVYNCSDQLLHMRARRKMKVRDTAAREARESVFAVERWKRATEAAKSARNKVSKFPGDFSRTLSRGRSRFSSRLGDAAAAVSELGLYDSGKLSAEHLPQEKSNLANEKLQESHLLRVDSGQDLYPQDLYSQDLYPVEKPAEGNGILPWSHDLYPANGPEHYDLYETVQVPPVANYPSSEGAPPSKEMEVRKSRSPALTLSHSQVYKYAYGQIEKEKFKEQAKPMSLTELVDSVGFQEMMESRGRRQMEIAFVDLSLILKGSGKRILSNVTGKFTPGRITAVMGPSGAGKTTFLNALAGKETGSQITGQVFINGYPGSMQSYKRIIGFVPQDDIVHGSLTVEENLRFSARYRLPVNTPRQDRVLAVERVLHSLGLTAIRDALVGTVEKRGISGGQRKRVNVGMELVIEPSLLILDEPTSGLDSTSSRLVMQSLRREAALGVNVLVVLHQPSYALFQMFDDVAFLARGGYNVYLGPVTEIEGYFSSLGFDVPGRTNPPDFFMDVLEGLVVPENDPSFDINTLPLLWMCHNGYHIPLHLQESADRSKGSGRDTPSVVFHDAPKSVVREAWEDYRVRMLVRWDLLKTSFASVKDLSDRQTPGFLFQYRLIFERVLKQKFRESRLLAQDFIILLLAGICVGVLSGWKDTNLGGTSYIYTIIAVALLIMIASLRTFSGDKLHFWRESSSGINRLAFFLAKDSVDHFNSVVKPVVYLSMFYFFNNPRSTFASNYIITLALVYCCTGLGYIFSIVLNPQPAQLTSVFVPVVATLLVSDPRTGILGQISKLSYAYWALQAYTIANVERYSGVWLITRCAALRRFSYRLDNYNLCLAVLFGYGAVARIIAYFCLLVFHRKRQK